MQPLAVLVAWPCLVAASLQTLHAYSFFGCQPEETARLKLKPLDAELDPAVHVLVALVDHNRAFQGARHDITTSCTKNITSTYVCRCPWMTRRAKKAK